MFLSFGSSFCPWIVVSLFSEIENHHLEQIQRRKLKKMQKRGKIITARVIDGRKKSRPLPGFFIIRLDEPNVEDVFLWFPCVISEIKTHKLSFTSLLTAGVYMSQIDTIKLQQYRQHLTGGTYRLLQPFHFTKYSLLP